jgi:predicted CXXCH cytochrome family protein
MHSLSALLISLTASGAWAAKDSCFACHSVEEGTSIVFQNDIHYKNGMSCADCHGGDAQEDDGVLSMSAERGFKVRVKHEEVAAYCGRCHSDAAFMGKHKAGARTDQVALYSKSVHGVELAKGNRKAANCIDCHGVHNIRAVDDPQSVLAPARLAAKCGFCHEEEAALFQQSPHAKVFTASGMAACTACHSSHATERPSASMLIGAKPVCAGCHAADSAGGKAAAGMAKRIAGLPPADQGASARQAAHALKLAP